MTSMSTTSPKRRTGSGRGQWMIGPGLALAWATAGWAVPPPPAPPRFPAKVDVVKVSVLVTGRGRPITGLAASDFEVEDDGVAQKVEQFSAEERPLRVVLALDVSGSVQGEILARLERACAGVVDLLRPGDTAGLLTFGDDVRLIAPVGDPSVLRAGLRGLEAAGSTALRDAVFATLTLADTAPDRALGIVFTDGRESISWLPEKDVSEAVRRSHSVLYGVHFGKDAFPFLGDAVGASGGRVLSPRSAEDLPAAFAEILQEFRTRYLLRYTPSKVAHSGWHRVRVRLKGRSARLTYRDGYFVP